jgi:transglycosylase-like protein with SLT domain
MKHAIFLFITCISALYLVVFFFPLRIWPVVPFPPVDAGTMLKTLADRSIEISNPKVSQARRMVISDLLVHTALSTFSEQEYRKYWITLVGVESRYDGKAVSSTGALGIGQLIPSYRNDFGKTCMLTNVELTDLQDDALNLKLSACYFNELIKSSGGNVPLAMVAYNAGPNSKSYVNTQRGGSPNEEASAYVTRIVVQKAKSEGKK